MAIDEIDTMNLAPLETPVLKVSRPVAACSRCRNAKIKCDGKLPACSSCEKNGRAAECTSTNDQFARGKERSYVSTLETRIDKLQTKLEEARARKPSVIDIPEDESAAPSRRPSYQVPEPLTPTTNKFQRRREVSAIDDLVSDFGFLSVNATARDFYGFTTAMSYARLILSACSKDPLPEGTTKALPPRYTATALIQFYLNNVFVLLPAFDEATFYASVDNIYLKDFRKADPLDHWMVRMVLAIASASRSEQQGDQCYLDGIGHVCAALEHAESVLHPGNISGVQALVLLTEYAMLDPHHFDSWNLIGAASRAMTDLGLHQDPPKGTAMPRSKLELRRRVFHCIYALDRSTSLVQTRAFSFSDDSAKVKVPFQKQASAPTSPQAGPASQPTLWLQSYEQALDLITLRKLQSTWYTDLFQSGRTRWDDAYPYLWDTCDSIRRWFENLSPSATPNMRAFFELDLLYSYVYVLSPSPRVPVILPFAQKLIFEYCIRYAELMLRLISDHGHTVPLTFYDAMRVYMTGRQFLDVLQHNTEMLLNGLIPPHPEVKPTTAPPPPMPVAPLPPGETVQCFNTVRSINCIKQITECLARFGIRWGYMSWNQRYQTETSGLLDELNQRLGELDEMNGNRRPSMWQQQGSTGSIPSSNGSISYHSPPQGVAHPSAMYQPPPPPPQMPQIPSFNEAGLAQRISPPQFHQQPNLYPQQQYQVPQNIQFSQPHQQYQHPQPQSYQQFNVNDPAFANPAFSQRPSQQFATWTGYGGVSVHDKPDDENAYLHRTDTSTGAFQNMQRPVANTGEMPRLSIQQSSRAGIGMSPRASIPEYQQVNRPTTVIATQAMQQSGMYRYILEIPPTSRLPPLTRTGTNPLTGPATAPAGRRTSMQDAALDVLQSTYPPAVPPVSARESMPSPTLRPMPRPKAKGKGKGKQKVYTRIRFSSDGSYPGMEGGFTFEDGIGYVCVACGQACRNPGLHQTLGDGGRCMDFGSNMVPQSERDLISPATTMPPAQNWMQGPTFSGCGFGGDGAAMMPAQGQTVPDVQGEVTPMMSGAIPPPTAQMQNPVARQVSSYEERRLSESGRLFF